MTSVVSERVLAKDEIPWESLKQIGRDSLRQMQRTRFYLQPKEVPCGEPLAVFVSNLPCNLSQRQYEKILLDILGRGNFSLSLFDHYEIQTKSSSLQTLDNKYTSIGPIYYEYGSMVITYPNSEDAIQACYTLKDATCEERTLSGIEALQFLPCSKLTSALCCRYLYSCTAAQHCSTTDPSWSTTPSSLCQCEIGWLSGLGIGYQLPKAFESLSSLRFGYRRTPARSLRIPTRQRLSYPCVWW